MHRIHRVLTFFLAVAAVPATAQELHYGAVSFSALTESIEISPGNSIDFEQYDFDVIGDVMFGPVLLAAEVSFETRSSILSDEEERRLDLTLGYELTDALIVFVSLGGRETQSIEFRDRYALGAEYETGPFVFGARYQTIPDIDSTNYQFYGEYTVNASLAVHVRLNRAYDAGGGGTVLELGGDFDNDTWEIDVDLDFFDFPGGTATTGAAHAVYTLPRDYRFIGGAAFADSSAIQQTSLTAGFGYAFTDALTLDGTVTFSDVSGTTFDPGPRFALELVYEFGADRRLLADRIDD